MWARPEGADFILDNIPFYATSVALGDRVSVVAEPDGGKRFKELVAASGHSTLQVVVFDKADVLAVREVLKEMGCPSELSDLPRLIAVDIPPDVDYGPIREWLEDREQSGDLSYREACLAHTVR